MSRLGTYMGLGGPVLQVEHVSIASTRITLTDDQQGKLLILDDSTASTVEIALPAPEAGMQYTLFFSTGAAGQVTKILSTAFDIKTDGTTEKGCVLASTAEDGQIIVFTAISDARWLAWGGSPYTTLAAGSS